MTNLLRASKPRHLRLRSSVPVLCAILAFGLSGGTAAAQKLYHSKQHHKYQRCIALSKSNPDAAFDMALAWHDFGGGEAAGHCIATALMGLKIYNEAAYRLETLAQSSKAEADVRAGMLAQAAQAWLLDGNLGRAEFVLTTAIGLQPNDPSLYIDRAAVFADQKNYTAAIKDLNHAIKLDSTLADSYVFRASAHRRLKKFDAAKADIEQALRLDPGHIAGLLERGILRILKGDTQGARADWLEILKRAPGSPAAESAQNNLEKMDVKK